MFVQRAKSARELFAAVVPVRQVLAGQRASQTGASGAAARAFARALMDREPEPGMARSSMATNDWFAGRQRTDGPREPLHAMARRGELDLHFDGPNV